VRAVGYTTAARYDIVNAADFYKSESPPSARRFIEDVDETAALLLEFPAIGQRYRRGTHRFRSTTPYFLYYVILSDGIRITAVAHQAQHPARWDDRLR